MRARCTREARSKGRTRLPTKKPANRGHAVGKGQGRDPAFVDAHVHLDKAFLAATWPTEARLGAAIDAVGAFRGKLTLERTRAHAERAVALLCKNGITAPALR